jgi:hypothetical protein
LSAGASWFETRPDKRPHHEGKTYILTLRAAEGGVSKGEGTARRTFIAALKMGE